MSQTFADMVEAAQLDHVDQVFDAIHDRQWAVGGWVKGDEVRGELRTFEMPLKIYNKSLAEEALYPTLPEGTGYVTWATAYELLAYAADGWNGRDSIVAIGSQYNMSCVPMLLNYRGKRLLEVVGRGTYWRNKDHHHLLYVLP